MRIRVGVSSIAVVAVTAMTMVAFSPLASTAGAHVATEQSTCRGSVARVALNGATILEPVVVQNATGQKCTAQTKTLVGPLNSPGLLSVAVGTAKTTVSGTVNHPTTFAQVANLGISVPGVLSIGAQVIEAQTTAGKCSGTFGTPNSRPILSSTGKVVGLTINGGPVQVDGNPVNIPLPLGLGTLSLNKVTTSAFSITRQAINLSIPLLGISVIVSEAQSGFVGHPCDGL